MQIKQGWSLHAHLHNYVLTAVRTAVFTGKGRPFISNSKVEQSTQTFTVCVCKCSQASQTTDICEVCTPLLLLLLSEREIKAKESASPFTNPTYPFEKGLQTKGKECSCEYAQHFPKDPNQVLRKQSFPSGDYPWILMLWVTPSSIIPSITG